MSSTGSIAFTPALRGTAGDHRPAQGTAPPHVPPPTATCRAPEGWAVPCTAPA